MARWADINVTPMIDILLVLLIIFMVIVPVTPQGTGRAGAAAAQGPAEAAAAERPHDRGAGIYRPGQAPAYKINETEVNKGDLAAEAD